MEPRYQRNDVKQKSSATRGAVQFGGRPPLFDRLCGDPAAGPGAVSLRAYSVAEVFDSVVREVRALLNTRLPVGPTPADSSGMETVLTYGFPDFSSLNAASPSDRQMLARVMERKIEAFEPRLRNVFVSFEPVPGEGRALTGTLEATLLIGTIRRPVSFQLLQTRGGVTLMESEPEQPDANR
jgi:type VI secretion system protein ImpF